MICHCQCCRYTFSCDSLPDSCPDCGKAAVRSATDSEIRDYERIRAEIAEEDHRMAE